MIKKIYFLFLLTILCTAGIQAQEHSYVPLVREGVTWNYCYSFFYEESVQTGLYQNECMLYSLYFDGDTTINNKAYKRCFCNFEGTDYLVAFMREADKRVYAIRNEEGSEAIANKYNYYITDDFDPDSWDERGFFDTDGTNLHEWVDGEMLIYDFNNMDQKGYELVSIDGAWRYGNQHLIEGIGPINRDEGDFLHPYPDLRTCLLCSTPLGLINVVDSDGHEEYRSEEGDRLSAFIYTPLVREGVRWIYRKCDVRMVEKQIGEDYWVTYEGKGEYAYFMEFRGDTIIKDRSYKKLYLSMHRNFDESTMRPVAYMREDTKAKQVYVVSDPEGRFQFVPEYDLELIAGGMALHGPTSNWEEYLLYDFSDIESFANQVVTWCDNMSVDWSIVKVGDKPTWSYYIHDDLWNDFTVTQGVGNHSNLLYFGPDDEILTCICCPISLGLAQLETLDGDILFKGPSYYGPYQPTGVEDISYVNHIINITLGKEIFKRHYFYDEDEYCDVNGDYQIDITDVSKMIDIILGK